METPLIQGYMMWKEGKPYGHPPYWAETRQSLLSGYHLGITGQAGEEICETLVTLADDAVPDSYAAIVRGQFVPHMLAWSVCQESKDRSFDVTAFYFGERRGSSLRMNRPIHLMTDEEAYTCDDYYHFSVYMRMRPDQRRRRTLSKIRQRVIAIFERHSIEIVPICYRLLTDVS